MHQFVGHDYEQNRIYEKQYLVYQEKLEMSRKQRAEKGIEVYHRNLSAVVSLCLILLRRAWVSFIRRTAVAYVCCPSTWVKNYNRYNKGSEE